MEFTGGFDEQMTELYFNTLLLISVGGLLTTLIAVIGWIGRRALNSLDEINVHLCMLNHRTEKLEERMTTQETRREHDHL